MSKCIDCGANFVSTPEQPLSEGMRCKWCEIRWLKAELAKAQAELGNALRRARASGDEYAALKAENARLTSELTNYKLGFATANEELARLRAARGGKP